ncbi:MAG: protein translocase subunit SecF [Bacillota bacterium]
MFSFIKHRRIAYAFSGLLLLAGVISLLLFGLNLGIDFAGGTVFHLYLGEEFTLAQVEEAIAPFPALQGAALQVVQGRDLQGNITDEGVVIKTAYIEEDLRDDILDALRARWPGLDTNDLRVESVGGIVSGELARQALLALAVAIAAMVAYISIRFEFKFALATIAALLHDVLIVVGVFSILRMEINVPFVAAILTVFGYSVNDTIVIIDRIRENIKHKRKDEYGEVVDQSIRQSLVRSLNTSLTTLIVLIALLVGFHYFIGSLDLFVFIVALIIGILIGTYSSIFIASPLWLNLKELEFRRSRRRKTT